MHRFGLDLPLLLICCILSKSCPTDFGPIDIGLIDFLKGGCSHSKSHKYLAESCLQEYPDFAATLCDSWESYTAGKCEGNTVELFGLDDYVK